MDGIITLIILMLVGVYDLYLYFSGQLTISQHIHKMFPKAIDLVILCVILGVVWYGLGLSTFVVMTIGSILGHLFFQSGD